MDKKYSETRQTFSCVSTGVALAIYLPGMMWLLPSGRRDMWTLNNSMKSGGSLVWEGDTSMRSNTCMADVALFLRAAKLSCVLSSWTCTCGASKGYVNTCVGRPLQTQDNLTEWVALFRESGLRDDVTVQNMPA